MPVATQNAFLEAASVTIWGQICMFFTTYWSIDHSLSILLPLIVLSLGLLFCYRQRVISYFVNVCYTDPSARVATESATGSNVRKRAQVLARSVGVRARENASRVSPNASSARVSFTTGGANKPRVNALGDQRMRVESIEGDCPQSSYSLSVTRNANSLIAAWELIHKPDNIRKYFLSSGAIGYYLDALGLVNNLYHDNSVSSHY